MAVVIRDCYPGVMFAGVRSRHVLERQNERGDGIRHLRFMVVRESGSEEVGGGETASRSKHHGNYALSYSSQPVREARCKVDE